MAERPRVLLVDDNEAMLKAAASALEQQCVIVGAVKDGQAALASAATLQPDVIVLDISMPGMTGLEVAARLRATGSTAAIVFLTVHQDEDLVEAARAVGALGYVTKGRLLADLATAVFEVIAGRPFVSPFDK